RSGIRSVGFFFQAEDGIRDKLVTGVQTCALPIYGREEAAQRDPRERPKGVGPAAGTARVVVDKAVWFRAPAPHYAPGTGAPAARSEERRVGKEWSTTCGR